MTHVFFVTHLLVLSMNACTYSTSEVSRSEVIVIIRLSLLMCHEDDAIMQPNALLHHPSVPY